MRNRRIAFLAVVLAAVAAAAPLAAYEWCAELACFLPPRTSCDAYCLTCGPDSGTDYDGIDHGTCQYPIVVRVGDIQCPCLQSSTPNLGEGLEGLSLEELLSVPAPAPAPAPVGPETGVSMPAR